MVHGAPPPGAAEPQTIQSRSARLDKHNIKTFPAIQPSESYEGDVLRIEVC